MILTRLHLKDIKTIRQEEDNRLYYTENQRLKQVYSILAKLSKFYKLIKKPFTENVDLEDVKTKLDELMKLNEYVIGIEYLCRLISIEIC